jgi:hypothetical protein
MSQENQKKTRLKGTATTRTCVGPCGQTKDRFKCFRPRWSRCAKHRIKGGKGDPNCDKCVALINGNVRQPRCIECDSKRTTKKGKKITTVAAPVAAPVVVPTAPVEPVTVNTVATVETTAATPVQAPAPLEPTPAPTPETVTVAAPAALVEASAPAEKPKRKAGLNKLADLAKLIDDETGSKPV